MVRLSVFAGVLCVATLAACSTETTSEPAGADGNDECDASRFLGVGLDHACAVMTTGEVACWGAAHGNGTTENQTTPVVVPGLRDVIAVTAGASHSCALLTSREVVCWGGNTSGQLGRGTTEGQLEPAPVSNLSDVRRLSAGGGHTCALLDTGDVLCWGANAYGELGPAAAAVQTTPILVAGVSNVGDLSAGGGNTCAVLESGEVACWGYHWEDTVGTGSSDPIVLPGITNAVQVSAGQNHDCVVLETGEAACRGYGRQGQLGDGGDATKDDPQRVLNLVDATRIAAGFGGYGHTCALRQTGDVVCWGIHTSGQLGNSSTEVQRSPAEPVLNLVGAIAIGAGQEHSCALERGGEVMCWGSGDSGQLGNGSTADQGTVTVSGLLAATCP